MIDDPTAQGIRALFDWRLPAAEAATRERGDAAPGQPSNADLALALQLLSCNPRDREQFRAAAPAA